MIPKRIRFRNGMRLAQHAVYCGRPSRWGNPFVIGQPDLQGNKITHDDAVRYHRDWIDGKIAAPNGKKPPPKGDIKGYLKGKDLACWCELHESCHCDYLLEIANAVR